MTSTSDVILSERSESKDLRTDLTAKVTEVRRSFDFTPLRCVTLRMTPQKDPRFPASAAKTDSQNFKSSPKGIPQSCILHSAFCICRKRTQCPNVSTNTPSPPHLVVALFFTIDKSKYLRIIVYIETKKQTPLKGERTYAGHLFQNQPIGAKVL